MVLDGSVTADSPFPGARAFSFSFDTESVDYVVDLPRASFAGGRIEPAGGEILRAEPADPTFFRATVDHVALIDSQGNWRVTLALDRPYPVTVTDVWDPDAGRIYRVRIQLHAGPWPIDGWA